MVEAMKMTPPSPQTSSQPLCIRPTFGPPMYWQPAATHVIAVSGPIRLLSLTHTKAQTACAWLLGCVGLCWSVLCWAVLGCVRGGSFALKFDRQDLTISAKAESANAGALRLMTCPLRVAS
eukprot:14115701-Alexandrium_andersonii.AAC.1